MTIVLELTISKRLNFSIVFRQSIKPIWRTKWSEWRGISLAARRSIVSSRQISFDLSRCFAFGFFQWNTDSSSSRSIHVSLLDDTIEASSSNSRSTRRDELRVDTSGDLSRTCRSSADRSLLLSCHLHPRKSSRILSFLLAIDRSNNVGEQHSSTSETNDSMINEENFSLSPSLSMDWKIRTTAFVCPHWLLWLRWCRC